MMMMMTTTMMMIDGTRTYTGLKHDDRCYKAARTDNCTTHEPTSVRQQYRPDVSPTVL